MQQRRTRGHLEPVLKAPPARRVRGDALPCVEKVIDAGLDLRAELVALGLRDVLPMDLGALADGLAQPAELRAVLGQIAGTRRRGQRRLTMSSERDGYGREPPVERTRRERRDARRLDRSVEGLVVRPKRS